MTKLQEVSFLGFDVFGTVVDWRTGVARAAAPFLQRHALNVDPFDFADQWRARYQPSMQRVRSGERPFVTLDVLNRENLEAVLSRQDVDFGRITDAELAELNKAWEKLDPWPDSVTGLTRLKGKFSIGALSNGHIAGMLNLAKFGGLPWDVILGAEIAGTYKPQPQTYLKSAKAVGLAPEQVAMVAAHNSDLAAARATGLKTVFVRRPTEHGPGQTSDLKAEQDWDVVVDSLTEAADALGC
ncbi:Phosphoglycolate phosphatase [Pseudomonas fluorescens]|uniref:(S)-2-haloacid dehalogenase n=1 Tax=Pseudomonas fluorescens TaxID=294 RepID=A0A5E6P6X7_PSEFL|nr:haloacid dehalogenase type II [Pseudomonas fluorescens]VVM39055.1 Phosphoglycolate phosphatase [Pseudomonas fluorescens]